MFETGKCYGFREIRGDFKKYLNGYGIDIGGGDDCLRVDGEVDLWDKQHGDANYMKGVTDNKYDFVYSSHCLEHVVNVEEAIKNWVRISKKYIYIVVPDFYFYEKEIFPSRFNGEHKHTFSMDYNTADRDNHWTKKKISEIAKKYNAPIIKSYKEIYGYDGSKHNQDQTMKYAVCQLCFILEKSQRER